MKAKVVEARIRPKPDGEAFEVVIRLEGSYDKFVESVHHRQFQAEARVKELLRPGTMIETEKLTPTV